MEPDARRFMELALARLKGTAELKLSAEGELGSLLEKHAAGAPKSLEDGIRALEKRDPGKGWRWQPVLLAICLLVSVPLLVHTALKVEIFTRFYPDGYSPTELGVSPENLLLLSGNTGAVDGETRWKALWESDPENPAFLSEYVLGSKTVPKEALEAAGKIDPDNSWFLLSTAAARGDGAVSRKGSGSVSSGSPRPAALWTVKNKARLDEALAALHDALAKPGFRSYRREMMAKRIQVIPPPRDVIGQMMLGSYAQSLASGGEGLSGIGALFGAGAQEAAAAGNREEFLQIIADWRELATKVARSDSDLVGTFGIRSIFTIPVANFRDGATRLGLDQERDKFAALHNEFEQDRIVRNDARTKGTALENLIDREGSFLTDQRIGSSSRSLLDPPPIRPRELASPRYAEHALFQRACTWMAWIAMFHCVAIAAGSKNRQPPVVKQLGSCFQDLFKPGDWVRVIGIGIGLPLLWYFVVVYLTPASARGHAVMDSYAIAPGGQFGSLVLAMILLPVEVTSRRLEKRAAFLGLQPLRRWPGTVATGAALLAVPCYAGMLLPGMPGQVSKVVAIGLNGIAGSWIFVGLVLCFMANPRQALRRATLGHLLWPVWAAAMLMLALLSLTFQAEERYWVGQDELNRLSAEFPMTRYGEEAAARVRANALQMLDSAEKGR